MNNQIKSGDQIKAGDQFSNVSGGGGGSTTFITSGHGTDTRNDFTGIVGMKFTASANMTVTDLGFMVIGTPTHTHVVYLQDSDGVVLAQTSAIDPTGWPNDTYKYGSITPTALVNGDSYFIQVAVVTLQDSWYNDLADVVSTADGTITSSTFAAATGVTPSASTSGTRSFGPTNFKYTKP